MRILGVIVATMSASMLADPSYSQNRAETFTAPSCDYWDQTGKSADGPCLLRTVTINGNFAYILTFGDGTRVTVEYVNRQGPYHIWKINGRPAFGYEVNREELHGATLDLKATIEWSTSSRRR